MTNKESDFHLFIGGMIFVAFTFAALVFESIAPVLIPIGFVAMGLYLAIAHFAFKV